MKFDVGVKLASSPEARSLCLSIDTPAAVELERAGHEAARLQLQQIGYRVSDCCDTMDEMDLNKWKSLLSRASSSSSGARLLARRFLRLTVGWLGEPSHFYSAQAANGAPVLAASRLPISTHTNSHKAKGKQAGRAMIASRLFSSLDLCETSS